MKRKTIPAFIVLALAIMMGVLATFGPGVAKADSPGGLTCNGSVPKFRVYYDLQYGGLRITDTHNCNTGKTYAYEMQYNSQSHPMDWHDFGYEQIRASANCTNGCTANYTNKSIGCGGSLPFEIRFHVWWGDGDAVTTTELAGQFCYTGYTDVWYPQ